MIRFLYALLLAALVTSCNNGDDGESKWITLSQPNAVLHSSTDSETTITVEALGEWSLDFDGSGYNVSPTHGGKGTTKLLLTALASNNTTLRQRLGSVTIRYKANNRDYAFDVFQRPATAPQTILLYMPGRSLLPYFQTNIESISTAIEKNILHDSRLVICYQPQSHTTAKIIEIYYDPETRTAATQPLKTYTSFRASDPAAVTQMLSDVAELAPAQQYGMIIGCHGKAWVPSNVSLLTNRQQKESDNYWAVTPGALPTRAFGDGGYELDTPLLTAAIKAQSFAIDYLIFDACFMANIETLYDLRGAADYVIASPCEIMAAGFPYQRALPQLLTNNGASYDLQKVCWEFWNFYQNDWNSVPKNAQSGCISMAVMAEIDPLASVMRDVNAAEKRSYTTQLQYYEGLSPHLFYDLGHYVELSCGDAALRTRFAAQFDQAFPKAGRLHTARFYSGYSDKEHPITYYSGVSISEPSTKFTTQNQATAWYQATH